MFTRGSEASVVIDYEAVQRVREYGKRVAEDKMRKKERMCISPSHSPCICIDMIFVTRLVSKLIDQY